MWQIRGVSDETIEAAKEQAKARGLIVGEYINFVIGEELPNRGGIGRRDWTISNMKTDSIRKIKKQALLKNMALADYLDYLAENVGEEVEAKNKVEKILEILED